MRPDTRGAQQGLLRTHAWLVLRHQHVCAGTGVTPGDLCSSNGSSAWARVRQVRRPLTQAHAPQASPRTARVRASACTPHASDASAQARTRVTQERHVCHQVGSKAVGLARCRPARAPLPVTTAQDEISHSHACYERSSHCGTTMPLYFVILEPTGANGRYSTVESAAPLLKRQLQSLQTSSDRSPCASAMCG